MEFQNHCKGHLYEQYIKMLHLNEMYTEHEMGHPKYEVTDGKVTLDADLNPKLYAERVCSRTNGIELNNHL